MNLPPSNIGNLLAVITMVGWGVSNGFMKVPTLKIGSAKSIRFRQAVMIASLIIYSLIFQPFDFSDTYWLLLTIGLGTFGYLPFLFFCEALKVGSIGLVNAIANSFPVITLILSHYFLGLPVSNGAVYGILIATSGVLLLSLSKKDKSNLQQKTGSSQAIVFALLASFFWGIFYTIVPIPNNHLDPITLTICLQFGTFISSHLHCIYENKKKNISSRTFRFAFLAGITGIIGSLCFYNALHFGNSSVVTAIAGSSPIVAAIFGNYVYKERINRLEIFGILVAVIGVVTLSYAK